MWKSKINLFFLCLGGTFSATLCKGDFELNKVPTPSENTVWISHVSDPSITLQLYNSDGIALPSTLEWETSSGILAPSSTYEIFPGTHKFEAHPEYESLEHLFLKMFGREFNKDLHQNNGTFRVPHISDYFPEIETQIQNKTLSHLYSAIKRKLHKAQPLLKNFQGISHLPILENYFDIILDAVQPLQRNTLNENHAVDAFVLVPLEGLIYFDEKMLTEILAIETSNPKVSPLINFIHDSSIPLQLRTSILSLFTHNHLTENYFLYGVALKFGVEKSFALALTINQIYAMENAYWESKAINGLVTLNNMNVPTKWIHHYYGSIITTLRLKNYITSETIITKLMASLGLSYKLLTKGSLSKKDLITISDIYSRASSEALRL